MEQKLLEFGIGGIIAFVAWKALAKVYSDMQDNHKRQLEESSKREEKLMNYLDEKTQADMKITLALDNIVNEITQINNRMNTIENKIIEKTHEKSQTN